MRMPLVQSQTPFEAFHSITSVDFISLCMCMTCLIDLSNGAAVLHEKG